MIDKDLDLVNFVEVNRSKNNYFVRNESGKLTIGLITVDNQPKDNLTIVTDKVQYIGSNKGEWGGELVAKWPEGTTDKLINDNIVALIPEQDDLYVFTGLAHLTSNRGAVYKILNFETKPKVEKVTLLPQAPNVVLRNKQQENVLEFVIITSSGVTLLEPEYDDLKVLDTKLFWGGLYPNSAVQTTDGFLIGMRSGIASFSLTEHAGWGPRTVSNVKYFTK